MNKHLYVLIAILVVAIGLGACTPSNSVEVSKSITFVQEGNYLNFEHTTLEPGMVFVLSYDGKTYQLDTNSVNVQEKDGKVSGQVSLPMITERVSAVSLSYRKVFCTKAFVLGIQSGKTIEFDCRFPDPK